MGVRIPGPLGSANVNKTEYKQYNSRCCADDSGICTYQGIHILQPNSASTACEQISQEKCTPNLVQYTSNEFEIRICYPMPVCIIYNYSLPSANTKSCTLPIRFQQRNEPWPGSVTTYQDPVLLFGTRTLPFQLTSGRPLNAKICVNFQLKVLLIISCTRLQFTKCRK